MNYTADLDMQIVARDGAVILLFSRTNADSGIPSPAMTDNMRMDPATALQASQVLADLAFEADGGLKPIGSAQKAAMVEKHRMVLIPRLATMLGSLRENKRVTNAQLAVQLTDVFCSEVFS